VKVNTALPSDSLLYGAPEAFTNRTDVVFDSPTVWFTYTGVSISPEESFQVIVYEFNGDLLTAFLISNSEITTEEEFASVSKVMNVVWSIYSNGESGMSLVIVMTEPPEIEISADTDNPKYGNKYNKKFLRFIDS
jgi:hypothetical protein